MPISFFAFGLGGVVLNVLAIWLRHYMQIFVLQFSLVTIPSLVFIFFIETPFHYYRKKDKQGLLNCILKISKYNLKKNKFGKLKKMLSKKFNILSLSENEENNEAENVSIKKNVKKKK